MGMMEQILRLMAQRHASDVFLSANTPAMIKIKGEVVPVNAQPLPPDAPRALLAEILPPQRIEELEQTGELNIAHSMPGVGRFRISGMRQRGSYAAVIRCINVEIPPLESLGVPPILGSLIMQRRGLILMVGATAPARAPRWPR